MHAYLAESTVYSPLSSLVQKERLGLAPCHQHALPGLPVTSNSKSLSRYCTCLQNQGGPLMTSSSSCTRFPLSPKDIQRVVGRGVGGPSLSLILAREKPSLAKGPFCLGLTMLKSALQRPTTQALEVGRGLQCTDTISTATQSGKSMVFFFFFLFFFFFGGVFQGVQIGISFY